MQAEPNGSSAEDTENSALSSVLSFFARAPISFSGSGGDQHCWDLGIGFTAPEPVYPGRASELKGLFCDGEERGNRWLILVDPLTEMPRTYKSDLKRIEHSQSSIQRALVLGLGTTGRRVWSRRASCSGSLRPLMRGQAQGVAGFGSTKPFVSLD
ncbi:hypothetical protein U1Q18_001475 [Sarracenia purpurea var. burkii]